MLQTNLKREDFKESIMERDWTGKIGRKKGEKKIWEIHQ